MAMVIVLSVITGLCYLSGFFTMVSGGLPHSTAIQEISSSISFVCGTIALVGAGTIHQLVSIKERLPGASQRAAATTPAPDLQS